MPPRLNIAAFARPIAFRPRPQVQWPAGSALRLAPSQCRLYSDSTKPPAADRSKREDAKPIEHVSEEAASMAQTMGEEGPDLSQGTPIEDVVRGDKAAQENLPKVMQDKLNSQKPKTTPNGPPKGSRSYSTMTTQTSGDGGLDMGLVDFQNASKAPATPGLKYEMPSLPLPKDGHVKHRHDPVVDQVTNLLMRHGKKSVAERNMALILQHLRTSPIPNINPSRPLLPGAPPPSHLPLNPVLYLTLAIDSVAPLMRIRSQRGAAGGGVALQIPVPLGQRQRRRAAIQWIMAAASKRRNMGSGKNSFAQRIAQELIAVVQGTSGIWDRRNAIHKLGVAARANILPREHDRDCHLAANTLPPHSTPTRDLSPTNTFARARSAHIATTMASLEAAIDEEMREVVKLLEGNQRRAESPVARAQSPSSAASPVRSMLDVDEPAQRRSSSRGNTGIPFAMPKSPRRVNPESAYKFEMLPSIDAHAMPKRVSQGGKLDAAPKPRAMSSVYGNSAGFLNSSNSRDRHNSVNGPLGRSKSGSPGPGRSASPATRMLNPTPPASASNNTFVTDSGKRIDMDTAYRKLSDSALARSEGGLASLPNRKGSDPVKGTSTAPGGGVRLATDDDGEDSAAVESSENNSDSSDWDDGWKKTKKRERGRQRSRKTSAGTDSMGREVITAKSLLAAAEQERRDVAVSYKVRSLLEPSINVTGPNGERMSRRNSSGVVHPHTSFDQGGSGLSTPVHSDHEDELAEIKSAQQLSLNISPIQSSPEAHRCVRQVIRGDYVQFAEDATKGLRRQRVYLVSTDLSDEAAYALEWTIGTVLRDGDTLLAVYAVDEETGVATTDASGAPISQGTTGRQESDHLKRTLSNHDGLPTTRPGFSALSNSIMATEANVSAMGKAEKDRYQACVEVSDRCVKLLRKTRLQVRAVVEVFHCKSPKHMITEVIDFLEPTLVILGSRGRNALKGVLLGSFSNYLVTKSSVPVMVARKRLRKHNLNRLAPSVVKEFIPKDTVENTFPFRLMNDIDFHGDEEGYIALSYCRKQASGNTPRRVVTPIGDLPFGWQKEVEQFPLPTSSALFQAVVRERNIGEGLWFDQVCIEQESEAERVAIIGAIDNVYKNARAVVVALDDMVVTPEEEQFLRYYVEQYNYCEVPLGQQPNLGLNPPFMQQYDLLKTLLHRIISSDWFERAWCAHEMRMGRNHVFLIPCLRHYEDEVQTIVRFTGAFFTHLLALASEVHSFTPALATKVHSLFEFFERQAFDKRSPSALATPDNQQYTDSTVTSSMSMVAETFRLKAGGNPRLPEYLRRLDANRDKTSIALNASGLPLALAPPNPFSRPNLEDECLRSLLLVGIAARDPVALCTTGTPLQLHDGSTSWLCRPTSVDTSTSRLPRRFPREANQIIQATDGRAEYAQLDLIFLDLPHRNQPSPSFPNHVVRARMLIDLCVQYRIPGPGLWSFSQAPDHPRTPALRNIFIQTLACILECGPQWVLEVMSSVREPNMPRMEPYTIEMLLNPHLILQNYILLAEGQAAMVSLVHLLSTLITSGIPWPSGASERTHGPLIISAPNSSSAYDYDGPPTRGSRAIIFAPFEHSRTLLIAVPEVIKGAEYSALARGWILTSMNPYTGSPKPTVSWTLQSKGAIFGDINFNSRLAGSGERDVRNHRVYGPSRR
ncbi:universal stress protein [Stemphylium lycopersici]|nr:universal stress protein [Stemphylium lycopersici]RAR02508.1 universal stress protein [Stemphylium lycopersici]